MSAGRDGAGQAVREGVDLRLLGPVRASRDGADLPLGSARRTAVLCVLALHAGHAVSREQLIAAVWGEDAPASATGNLYTYVSALRRILEPSRGRWTAGRLLASGGGTYQLHLEPANVDVHRFASWRSAARDRRADGDDAGELAALQAALALWDGEPLAGVPGPFADAQRLRLTELRLTTAERCAALLARDGRSEEAGRLVLPLRTAYPYRDPDVPEVTEPAPPEATLFGRDEERGRLRRSTSDAAAGTGRSVLITGGPGSGKSALLATVPVTGRIHGPGPRGAVADEVSRHLPLGVLREAAESAGVPGAASLDSAERAVERIVRAATTGPVTLLADDLHWADPLTLRVWAELTEQAARLPLLLVATARADAPELRGLSADEVIALAPLTSEAAGALVHATAPEPPTPRRLARILDDAGGNPYYLRHLASGEPCADVYAAVGVHLAPLSDASRQVLQAAAFLAAYELRTPGTAWVGCRLPTLATVTERSHADLARLLEAALEAGLLIRSGDRVEFRHRLVARTLHDDTPGALRATLHRSFALRIADAGGPPEQVATQLLAGDVAFDVRISSWLTDHVARLAERAPAVAVAVLQRARAHPGLVPAQRIVLTAWLARLLLRLGHHAAAEAGWVAARSTDAALTGEMRWVAASVHERRGEHATAAEIAHAALREHRLPTYWREQLTAVLARTRHQHIPDDAPRGPRRPAIGCSR